MTFFRHLFQDLVEKRLWPVALGLVVALVAVPVILSKPGGETAAESPAPNPLLGSGSAALLGEVKPAVSLGGDTGFRKHVARLPRKNPFVQQAKPKPATAETVTTPSPAGGGGGGATTPAVGTPTPTPTPAPTKAPTSQKFQYTAKVRFGEIGKTSSKTLTPGTMLPSDENPVVVFVGSDGSKAIFLVSTEATPRGDGDCLPSESNCQFLRMSKGDVEFLEVSVSADSVVTYELELRGIGSRELTTSANDRRPTRLPRSTKLDSRRLGDLRRAMRTRKVFRALGDLMP